MMKKVNENGKEKVVMAYCPYCGEDYMFNPYSTKRVLDEEGTVEFEIVKYYCDSCHNFSTILHDYIKDKISAEVD